jgi:hypothetical protein
MILGTYQSGDGVCVSVTWLVVVALILLIVLLALRVAGRR